MSPKKQLQPNAPQTAPTRLEALAERRPQYMVTLVGEEGSSEWFETFGQAKARALDVAGNAGRKVVVLRIVGEAAPSKADFTVVNP